MNGHYKPSDVTADAAYQLHRSALRLLRLLQASQPAKGLSSMKLSVLGRLFMDGPATATELAAYLRVRPQSLTRLIAELEKQKFIVRRSDDEDRRRNLLEIKNAGAHSLAEVVRCHRMTLAETMAKELTAAEQELLRIAAGLMDRIVAAMEDQTEVLRNAEDGGVQKETSE